MFASPDLKKPKVRTQMAPKNPSPAEAKKGFDVSPSFQPIPPKARARWNLDIIYTRLSEVRS
jgi:hypothetical protein